jgi:peptidyl-prolyl cis-trans isomerase D
MAALGSIRKRGVTLIIIVALGLFAFIAGDMFKGCEYFEGQKRQMVGEVLGEKVSIQDFQQLVEEYSDVIKMTQGRDNLSEEEQNQLRDQVWSTYVNNKLIEAEAEKLGLTVTDKELQDILREGTNPMLMQSPFVNQQTGRFDLSMLTKFQADYKKAIAADPQLAEQYQSINNYWLFIEKTLRQQTLAMKYQALLSHCLFSNPISAQMAFNGQNVESDIQLASLAYSTINDNDVKIEDADLKAYYDAHKEEFRQYVETRDVKYVTYPVVASQADRAALMKTMDEAAKGLQEGLAPAEVVRKAQSQIAYTGIMATRNAFPQDIAAKLDSMSVGQVLAPFETAYDNTLNVVKLINKTQLPDSVEYRQILVSDASVEVARTKADSIYKALQSGANFDTLAVKYGQPGQKTWLTSAMYERSASVDADSKNLISTLNTLGVNELKNVEMAQGNIIIQVTNRKAMTTKYDVAVVKHTIDFSKNTYNEAYNKFSQFVSENQTVEDMEKNAEKFGFKVLSRDNVSNTEHGIAGIRQTNEALRWAFGAKVGNVSQLYECGNNDQLLVVALTAINPVGYRSFEASKEMLKAEVLRDKKFEMLAGKLNGVNSIAAAQQKGAAIDTVRQVTFSAPVFVQATGGSEPAICGVVAVTDQGKFNPTVIKGNSGAYMLQVVKKANRADAKFDEKVVEQQLKQQALQAASRFMQELYLKADVVDNRYLFF